MSKTELKPCPFCGGIAIVRRKLLGYHFVYVVECEKCGAETKKHGTSLDKRPDDEAAAAWNRRVQGRWNQPARYTLSCSVCGFEIEAENKSNYCPECGAWLNSEGGENNG